MSMVGYFFKYNCLVLISIALGAHIPDISSEVGFFDVVYLGVFIILSTAFDANFYHGQKPPAGLVGEIACAIAHFHSLIYAFSQRFIILLAGEPVKCRYVIDRLLAECAAATVVLAKAVEELTEDKDSHINASELTANLEGTLQSSYPRVFSYYSRCMELKHSDFTWTGPELTIINRNSASSLLLVATKGKKLDSPSQPIYTTDVTDTHLPSTTSPNHQGEKQPVPANIESPAVKPSKKQKLLS